MRESFQRLLMMSEPEILPLQAQASRGQVRAPKRSQFSHLLRHFLERFFCHETASPDGDARTRLIQIAVAAGLPGFVVALYLWPEYHSFIPYLRNHRVIWLPGPPPYWAQVNQHFFFTVYSFVVMGIVAVFEWDLFFPDLLDICVLKPLPITDRRTFLARVTAIVILLGGLLFDTNVLATLVLPAAIDPPNLPRFLAGHIFGVRRKRAVRRRFSLGLRVRNTLRFWRALFPPFLIVRARLFDFGVARNLAAVPCVLHRCT